MILVVKLCLCISEHDYCNCLYRFCEEVVKVLGLDWVLLFVQGHLHPSTVLVALRMLVALLSNAGILQKFRDASQNGGWMSGAQQVTNNKHGQVLGELFCFYFTSWHSFCL